MDEFAQSRGTDDLFDDEIVPIDPQVDQVTTHVQHISLETAPKGPSRANRGYGYGHRNERGRGRASRSRGNNEPLTSRFAPQQITPPQPQNPVAKNVEPLPSSEPADVSRTAVAEQSTLQSPGIAAQPSTDKPGDPEINPPEQTEDLTTPAASRPAAVRGDRTATGGVKKPKLTEDELTEKLVAAKERSQNLSAAHARAQADAASFEERERLAQEKRAKDAVNKKAMEGEREKNRARKMAVMGGREWDAEKTEEDFRIQGRGRGKSGVSRGANGSIMDDRGAGELDVLRQYEWNGDRAAGKGRGGRGRGRGGSRGGSRGRGDARVDTTRQPDVGAETDFPSLPGTSKFRDDSQNIGRPTVSRTTSDVLSPSTAGGTWADQVESSEAAKAI